MRLSIYLSALAAMIIQAIPAATTIRTAAALSDLIDRSSDEVVPFELTGTVLRSMPSAHTNMTGDIILEDASGRVRVFNASTKTPVPGDVIHVFGDETLNEYDNPFACIREMEIIGKAPLPGIIDVPLRALSDKTHTYRTVRTEGQLIEVTYDEFDNRSAFLLLKDAETIIPVFVPRQDVSTALSHIGARIRVCGLYFSRIDGVRRFSGPFISLQGTYEIITPAPDDPFDVPLMDFRLNQNPRNISQLDKHRVNGTVLAAWSSNQAIVLTPEKQIVNIEFADGIPLPVPDDRISVVGYPQTDLYRIILVKSHWRSWQSDITFNTSAPVRLSLRQLIFDNRPCFNIQDLYHGQLIRLKGTVQTSQTSSPGSDGSFTISSDGSNIRVICPRALKMTPPQVGAVVDVTGICYRLSDIWQPYLVFPHIHDCQIILRHAEDVDILSQPPWLTPARVTLIVSILVFCLIAVFFWNRRLNRLIVQRSRELAREQLSHFASELKTSERTRLSVELHDTLSQNLAGLACLIGTSESALDTNPALAKQGLETANRMLQSCRTELRHCLFDLRNDMLEEEDFPTAIRKTLAQLEPQAQISIRFAVPRSLFHDATAHAILNIIRELVSNALRHGKATSIKIAGSIENGLLLFSVTDNGSGFDPETSPGPKSGHFGIDGIRERLSRRNGHLSFESHPGFTHARVEIPLPHENAAEAERA